MSIPTTASSTTACFSTMTSSGQQVHADYLDTLLRYYEEEIEGEAYFYGLAEHFTEREKTRLLARVERHAVAMIVPLLHKYDLQPRDEATLAREGRGHVESHQSFVWPQFMHHIIERYPGYLDDFTALERMAPAADLPALQHLTEHEVIVIDFAKNELAGDADSCAQLLDYLGQSAR
jgi:dimethylamine/trimethylamine dehydrogenase